MVKEWVGRAQGCLIGLAAGDALGGPAEGKSMAQIEEKYGRITGFISEDQVGSDDTEFALFNLRLLLRHGDALNSALIAEAWMEELAGDRTDFKGAGFSEVLAINNLRAGLPPPRSGVHLHAWSDGLAMRVAPFAIWHAGDPESAVALAALDGSVSHAGEGIFGGQVVAAVISMLMASVPLENAIAKALCMIPEDSWCHHAISEAIDIGTRSADVWGARQPLYEALVCTSFPWADLAPEAVGIAFGQVVASRGDFREALLGGANIGRDADTIAAIAGAILGAAGGIGVIPGDWRERVQRVRGSCIPAITGMDIIDSATELAEVAARRSSR
ncbi:MAG TPA: ADP-ribosylglycohydrolase family protein [bacterium]|nr:ADP-ribosylglycohydrolase family protein [bacterium]HOC87908.1 ADP-ribosylglycohydrolase family protein [bacterium]HOZ20515.1 ADP-ribosylglycohydrolase family protein [bacterium]